MTIEKGRDKEQIPLNRIIILVGPEGSGKSTIAKMLSTSLLAPYISTGDIIREKARSDEESDLKKACVDVVTKQVYLPAYYLEQLVAQRLSRPDTKHGIIMDGALRTLKETEDFNDVLRKAGIDQLQVDIVYLDVPESLGIERRLANPRFDDTPDGIKKRLSFFHRNLEERLKIMKQRYNFVKIDATGPIDEVYHTVRSRLNEKQNRE